MIVTFLEHDHAGLPKAALATIDAAVKARESHKREKVVGLLLGGEEVVEIAEKARGYGLDEVVYLSSDLLSEKLSVVYAHAMAEVFKVLEGTLLIAASTSFGKAVLPRVCSHVDGAQASDVLEFLEGGLYRRPMYAGDLLADVELCAAHHIASIRVSAFTPAEPQETLSPVRKLAVELQPESSQQFIGFDSVESERPELADADVVVSGGRALQSKEQFEAVLFPLADALGAALGASRAAVDAGYAPNDWQVGQTGKVVAPDLYIAVGISGAIQHLAGMKDSKVIVAINTDPDAPIFEIADYGLVADLHEVVPQLTKLVS